MHLTRQAVANMAAIILTETQGVEKLSLQGPLNVVDQGDRWLVKGTPYQEIDLKLNHCQFYIIFIKTTAEIIGIGSTASMDVRDDIKSDLLNYMTETDLHYVLGPRQDAQLNGRDLSVNLEFNEFLYGGLINTLQAAIEYAYNLLQSSEAFADIPVGLLSAEEKHKIWYISRQAPHPEACPEKILSICRVSGRILSGML